MQQLNIAFIGGGNMAEALIAGLLRSGHAPKNICVSEPQQQRRDFLTESYAITAIEDNALAPASADVLVLAVKPQQMQAVVKDLSMHLKPDASLVSIAAGVTTESLQLWLGVEANIIRVMPNTPAMVGAGMSVLFSDAGPEHRARAEYVMQTCGETLRIENEKQMHAVTAVSGSGPAYFFLLAEIMQATGVKLGLADELATKLAAQTAFGAGKMLIESGHSAEDLRHQVTSPGGTTQAALDTMYEMGLPAAVREAIVAACKRSEQLAGQ